ncbi:MAG: aspartate kinase [Proteobacteria bacterium]|jgi:aspartate kinase|nr:aspartate kinase [Pseudomonadota bacterium]MDA0941392.1 aspartate kinase [Pseudomonadota bacterium]MDA1033978.1 aspartate kinase [Pseudomonadota bacterium]
MSLIVQKYGGTSVANPERINAVADRVKRFVDKGHKVVVVVSAMSGETNKLLQLISEVNKKPDPRESDVVLSTGEQVTIGLTALAIQARGVKAKSYTGSQVKILTDKAHSKARIINIGTENIQKNLDNGYVLVIAGFQGADEQGNITTLGRGGSDTTAVAIAAALHADECQIYTDVNGIYTTDPRVVSNARKLKSITFEEMLEMASLGSKVLQIRSVEFAGKHKVNLRVLSSFEEDGEGTIITYEESHKMEDPIISGIAFNRDEAKVTVESIPDKPGIAYQILGPIAEQNIDVDMIIQNIGHDGLNDFTFTVNKTELDKTIEILESMKDHLGAKTIIGDSNIAKLSLVGVGMKSHVGVASKMFRTLSEEGINISTISTSEIKISILIEEKFLDAAVQSLHKAFNLDQ